MKIASRNMVIKYIQKTKQFFINSQSSFNLITDMKKIPLNPEFNFMEILPNDNGCQYNSEYIELYKKADPTILHFLDNRPNIN